MNLVKRFTSKLPKVSNGRFIFIGNNPQNSETIATAIYPLADLATAIGNIVQEVLSE